MAGDSPIIYKLFITSQLLTLVGYVIVTIGAAMLQLRANDLPLWKGLDEAGRTATEAVYNDVFQSTQYIIPYPKDAKYQFQYQWWIIQFELMVFLMTAPLVVFPQFIERVRPMALTFLASAMVIVMDNINTVSFLLRNDIAKMVFQEFRIEWTMAGLVIVIVANFLTVISLGLYERHPATFRDTALAAATGTFASATGGDKI